MKQLEKIIKNTLPFEEKLYGLIDFFRPKNSKQLHDAQQKFQADLRILKQREDLVVLIADELVEYLLRAKLSTSLATYGILSKNGLKDEIEKRFYDKFLPEPPKYNDVGFLIKRVFSKKGDSAWIESIPESYWIELFQILFGRGQKRALLQTYFFDELLYSLEILSVWLASVEFDPDFIRLDSALLDNDSPFLALHREIYGLLKNIKSDTIVISENRLDFQHIEVLLVQSQEQIASLKKKSVHLGISVSLTFQFERIEQMMERFQLILLFIQRYGMPLFHAHLLHFFWSMVEKNSSKNSLGDVIHQNIKILARSITNNTSEHGEHYITTTKKEYLKMFLSASGAGVVIAFMALHKMFITKEEYTMFFETLLVSLNYGIGFVLIHILGFTVATKQPAMTASVFAKAVEKSDQKQVNQSKLVDLFVQVSRSQFAAVMGNILLALIVSFGIAYYYISFSDPLLDPAKATYYRETLEPFPALVYAAIAGVWLFCAGLISGYFDNRANYLQLEQRYFHHPLLKKITTLRFREKLARYLHKNHGAFAGNFLFGVLLGVTPFLGYIFQIPIDIRHIAFSAANLGFTTLSLPFNIFEFLLYLAFVFMIGLTNLAVSFILALKVSLKSRDLYFGSVIKFIIKIFVLFFRKPQNFFFPPEKSPKDLSE